MEDSRRRNVDHGVRVSSDIDNPDDSDVTAPSRPCHALSGALMSMVSQLPDEDTGIKEPLYYLPCCFNCHTTATPCWRRSTLTPQEILCNMCGLYEYIHHRPRPRRFHEFSQGSTIWMADAPQAVDEQTQLEPAENEPSQLGISRCNFSAFESWDDNASLSSSLGVSPSSSSASLLRDENTGGMYDEPSYKKRATHWHK